MEKVKDRHIHAGIGPQDYVVTTLNNLGLTPDAVRVHMSDTDGELITPGDETNGDETNGKEPIARVGWVRRGLPPRKESKPTKTEKKERKKLKKKMKRRTKAITQSA